MNLRLTIKLIIAITVFTHTLFAQNTEKEPGQVIWQETFDKTVWENTVIDGQTVTSNLPEGWVFSDVTSNNYYWQWSNVGPRGRHTSPNGGTVPKNQLSPAAPINSTTGTSGFLLMPSDWYNTNDDGNSISPAISMNSFVEYGPINLSEYQQVHFRIEYFFKLLKPENSEISIRFRDNNDNSATIAINFQENIPSKNASVSDFNLTVLLEKNEINPEQIFFRITQSGPSHYFFMIDDIKFYQPFDRNLRILDTWNDYHTQGGTSTDVELHKDFFGGYKYIPLSIVDTFVQFRTQAQNFGGITRQNIYTQTEIQNLDINLINPVYTDTSSIKTLSPSEVVIFTNTSSFRPKLPGKYRITNTVTDGESEDLNLNIKQSEIYITNGLYSHVDTSSTSEYLPLQADTSSANYGYGQAYWVPNISSNKVTFNELSFFIHPTQNPNHLAAQEIEVQGYLFKKQGTTHEIVQSTEKYKPIATDRGKFVNLQFTNPQELDGNQNYYLILKVTNQSISRKLLLAHHPNHHQSYGQSGVIMSSSNNLIVVDKTPVLYTNITGGYIPQETDILAYNIERQTDNTIINTENKSITLTMPFNTNVSSLVPNFVISINAVAEIGDVVQTSGVSVVDFTNPVVYTIKNGDKQDEWTVTVNVQPEPPATFTSFTIEGQIDQTLINSENRTISLLMPNNTNLTELTPSFSITEGAEAFIGGTLQVSGITVNDFTNPVTYRLVSQSGISENWIVTVGMQGELHTGCKILLFGFSGQTQHTVIKDSTVTVNLSANAPLNSLVPLFVLSKGAKAYHLQGQTESLVTSGGNIIDFTSVVTFRVRAENEINFIDWKIKVTTNQNSQADFESFEVRLKYMQDTIERDTVFYANIFNSNNKMEIHLPQETILDSIKPFWTVSPGAIVKIGDNIMTSGESLINMSKPVEFNVISQQSQGSKQIKTWTLYTYANLVGIKENVVLNNIKMYPNPTSKTINVEVTEDFRNGSYQIFNIYGQTVNKGIYRGLSFDIDIQNHPKGIYFVKITSNRQYKIEKFLFE